MRGGADDGASPFFGFGGLAEINGVRYEDSRAHEDSFGAQLAYQGRIRRGSYAARREIGDGKFAGFSYHARQFNGRTQLLGLSIKLFLREYCQLFDLTNDLP